MTEKFTLREPDYLDLSVATWKLQPRDLFGRWRVGGSGVNPPTKKVFKDIPVESRPLPTFNKKHPVPRAAARELTREEMRKVLTLDHQRRQELMHAAGLVPKFKEDEVALIERWHTAKTPGEKAEIQAEMVARQKAMNTALAVIKEAESNAKREHRREIISKIDPICSQSKMGKALLSIKAKLVADKAFDAAEAKAKKAEEFSKEWLTHVAELSIVQGLIGATTALTAHLLSKDGMPEMVAHFLENPVVEGGIGAAVAWALISGTRAVLKHGKKEVPKVKAKVKKIEAEESASRRAAKRAARAAKAAEAEAEAGVHVPVKGV